MFLFHLKTSLAWIYVTSKWSLTSVAPPETLRVRRRDWPNSHGKIFFLNLPFKETGWDIPHITIGQPYYTEIGAEWNSRGTSKQASVHPTRGLAHILLIGPKSTRDPQTYVVDNLKAKVPQENTIQITNYSSFWRCTLRWSKATH